jgi:hypothetical protein
MVILEMQNAKCKRQKGKGQKAKGKGQTRRGTQNGVKAPCLHPVVANFIEFAFCILNFEF